MKTIAVVGGTGQQGGAVVSQLLGRYKVRVLTRDAASAKAQSLLDKGCDVFEGNLANFDSLLPFFRGADAAFIVTDFWAHMAKGLDAHTAGALEFVEGKNAVDAALIAGVQHLIVSTLDSARGLSSGAIQVPHFDYKAAIGVYAEGLCDAHGVQVSFVVLGFYIENLLGLLKPRLEAEKHVLSFNCDTAIPVVSVAQLGSLVEELLAKPVEVTGAFSALLTGAQLAEMCSKVSGKSVCFQKAKSGFKELDDMFEYYERFAEQRELFQTPTLADNLEAVLIEAGFSL